MPVFTWTDSVISFIFLAIVLLLVSGLFSLIKVVFLAVSETKDADDEELVRKVRANLESSGFGESISIARTFLNVTAGSLGLVSVYILTQGFYNRPVIGFILYAIAAGAITYVIVILIPNILGNLRPETFSRLLLPVYRCFRIPFVLEAKLANSIYCGILRSFGYNPKLSFLSEEKRGALQSDMTSSKDDDALDEDERQMVLNIFDFVETPVREIMTPRVDMIAIDVTASLEETIKVLNEERHSRLPVYRDSIDNIIGILSSRDFLEWYTEHGKEKFDLQDLVNPSFFVPHQKKIDDLLRELRKNGNQLAIVVDEYGGVAGLVTVEDIVEEIVGEIKDEDDLEEDAMIQRLKDGRYILDPLMTLSDFEDAVHIELVPPLGVHVETVSGVILAMLGSIPAVGAEIDIQGCKFRVLKVDGTRMTKVMLILPTPAHSER
ncbi:MAG: hemolysin family protein [Fibrobacteraceae bacterium]|nr:hemolysin family protein [Fibrobacteraceae bacterium]